MEFEFLRELSRAGAWPWIYIGFKTYKVTKRLLQDYCEIRVRFLGDYPTTSKPSSG